MQKSNRNIAIFAGVSLIVVLMLRKKIATALNNTSFAAVSDKLFNIISQFEGFFAVPYWDRTGYSVGYGSQYNWDAGRPVQKNDVIDKATAKRWLLAEAQSNYDVVMNNVSVPITDNQLLALASFTYNVGEEAFRTSTLLDMLNSGSDRNTVANQFDRWIYSGGIVNQGLKARRAAEKALFLS